MKASTKILAQLLVAAVSFFSPVVHSQSLHASWAITLGETGSGNLRIKADSEKNVYVVNLGTSFLAKYSANHVLLWSKTASSGSQMNADALAIDSDDNVYVTGTFSGGSVTFDTETINNTASNSNVYVVKYDKDGNVSSAYVTGESSGPSADGISVDGNENIYVTGSYSTSIKFGTTTLNTSIRGGECYIAKLKSDGSILWAKTSLGTVYTAVSGIVTDGSGNAFITGHCRGTVHFGSYTVVTSSDADIFLTKYDTDGNELWAYSEGHSGYNDAANDLAIDHNGDLYMVADYPVGRLGIIKYSNGGYPQWTVGSSGSNAASGIGICTDLDNNVYVTGSFYGDYFTVDTITMTTSSSSVNYIMVGKFSGNNGSVFWAAEVENGDAGQAVCSDGASGIYLAGYFGTADMTIGSTTLTDSDGDELFLAKFSSNNGTTSIFSSPGKIIATVYPNPTNGKINISGLEQGLWKVNINRMNGERIYQTDLSSPQAEINFSGQNKGLYFLELFKDGEYQGVAKVVVD